MTRELSSDGSDDEMAGMMKMFASVSGKMSHSRSLMDSISAMGLACDTRGCWCFLPRKPKLMDSISAIVSACDTQGCWCFLPRKPKLMDSISAMGLACDTRGCWCFLPRKPKVKCREHQFSLVLVRVQLFRVEDIRKMIYQCCIDAVAYVFDANKVAINRPRHKNQDLNS
eukprot:g73524.t1